MKQCKNQSLWTNTSKTDYPCKQKMWLMYFLINVFPFMPKKCG